MKNILVLLVIILSGLNIKTKAQILPCSGYPRYRNFYYYYDDNGNRVYREYIFVCPTGPPTESGRMANPDSLFAKAQTDTLLKSKTDNSVKTLSNDEIIELRKVYPNPTSGNFIVQLSRFVPYVQFQVYDIYGNVLLNDSFSGIEWNIDISLLPTGEYTLVIRTKDGKTYNKKIVKI
jgi:hypothetical protein